MSLKKLVHFLLGQMLVFNVYALKYDAGIIWHNGNNISGRLKTPYNPQNKL